MGKRKSLDEDEERERVLIDRQTIDSLQSTLKPNLTYDHRGRRVGAKICQSGNQVSKLGIGFIREERQRIESLTFWSFSLKPIR